MERLGTSGRGLVSVPSIVHGAPETAEVHPVLCTFYHLSLSDTQLSLVMQSSVGSVILVVHARPDSIHGCRKVEKRSSGYSAWQVLSHRILTLRYSFSASGILLSQVA